jgi:hypothetical protein
MTRTTQLIEMVETHNIAKSLQRLRDATGYEPGHIREARAIYHAVCMTYTFTLDQRRKIREAPDLP